MQKKTDEAKKFPLFFFLETRRGSRKKGSSRQWQGRRQGKTRKKRIKKEGKPGSTIPHAPYD